MRKEVKDTRKIFFIELHEMIKNRSEIRNQRIDPSKEKIVWMNLS